MKTRTTQFALGVLCSALLATASNAAESNTVSTADSRAVASTNETMVARSKTAAKDLWNRDLIMGEWFGARTNLANRGITFDLRLSQYWQGVASGGVQQKGQYGGTMDYRVTIDGDKLMGMKGFAINMHARTRFGNDIGSAAGALALPNTGMLSPLPGGYSGTDITGLTASQFLPLTEKRVANISFGKLDIIDTLTGLFPWIAAGQDGFMNLNAMYPFLPWVPTIQGLSLWGGAAMTINMEYMMPETGFLGAGTQNVTTSWDFADSFNEGFAMVGFHRFFWGDPKAKIGYFTIVGYGSTKEQASNDPNDIIFVPGQGLVNTQTKKPWGAAGFAYQEFWKADDNPNRKANFVIGGSGGPQNPQIGQWSAFGNVEAVGLLGSRPADRMGISGWYSYLSGTFTDLVSPLESLRNTWGVELYYNIAINKWMHVSPDLQLVQNQRDGDDFAIIPGIRMTMDF